MQVSECLLWFCVFQTKVERERARARPFYSHLRAMLQIEDIKCCFAITFFVVAVVFVVVVVVVGIFFASSLTISNIQFISWPDIETQCAAYNLNGDRASLSLRRWFVQLFISLPFPIAFLSPYHCDLHFLCVISLDFLQLPNAATNRSRASLFPQQNSPHQLYYCKLNVFVFDFFFFTFKLVHFFH